MKWPKVKLMQILSLEYGSALKEADRTNSGNFPVLGSNGVVGYHDKPLVDGPGVVVGRKGSAGKVTWVKEAFWPIDTTYYVKLEIHADIRWIFYLLNSLNLERFSIVTGVPGLNRNDVYNLIVHLPPFSEQRRIVEILDQADILRKKRAKAAEITERLLSTLLHRAFCGDLTANWRELHIKELLKELEEQTENLDIKNS